MGRQSNTVSGTIDKVVKGQFKATVKVKNADGTIKTTKEIPIKGDIDDLALKGEPEDFVNQSVSVEFFGMTSNTGMCIPKSNAADATEEEVSKHIEVYTVGMSYCPPGGMM
jgi:molybdopterin-binding protein